MTIKPTVSHVWFLNQMLEINDVHHPSISAAFLVLRHSDQTTTFESSKSIPASCILLSLIAIIFHKRSMRFSCGFLQKNDGVRKQWFSGIKFDIFFANINIIVTSNVLYCILIIADRCLSFKTGPASHLYYHHAACYSHLFVNGNFIPKSLVYLQSFIHIIL